MWLVQNFRAVKLDDYETLEVKGKAIIGNKFLAENGEELAEFETIREAKEQFQKVMLAMGRGDKVYFC